jgi:hypothetical protein
LHGLVRMAAYCPRQTVSCCFWLGKRPESIATLPPFGPIEGHNWFFQISSHTDKKEKKIFLIYKEIQGGTVAKSYMRKGFLIYEEMRNISPYMKCRLSYMTLQLLHSDSLIYEENLIFFFVSAIRVSKEPVCIDLFRQNPVFTSLHLRFPVHVVPPMS